MRAALSSPSCGLHLAEFILRKQLSELVPGEGAVVEGIASNPIAAKLVEMGLYSGKNVRVLYRAPLGDPIAVDVEGYTLSLRKDEAKCISVLFPASN